MDLHDRFDRVFGAKSSREISEHYDDWAAAYDADLTAAGYAGPARAADVIAAHVPTDASICDAGAGTGMLGQLLREKGFEDLIALDISSSMLDQARAKGIYRELHVADLGEPLDLPSSRFDCTASVGTLIPAHAPVTAVDEFVRITKPGGHVIFTMPLVLSETPEVISHLAGIEESGRWRLVERTAPFAVVPDGEPDLRISAFVYGVADG